MVFEREGMIRLRERTEVKRSKCKKQETEDNDGPCEDISKWNLLQSLGLVGFNFTLTQPVIAQEEILNEKSSRPV